MKDIARALMSFAYDLKLIQSGDVIEVIEYQHPILKEVGGRKPGSMLGRSVEACEQDKDRHREDTLQRARSRVRRLINANAGQWVDEDGKSYKAIFLTLTYAENMTDVGQGNKDLADFLRRLSYGVFGEQRSLKYVAVPEFQQRGAVHYHLVIFNLPFTPKEFIAARWGHGFIDIHSVDDVTNVGAYISKYLTKDSSDSRLKGRRCYMASHGLHEPVELKCRGDSGKIKELEKLTASLALQYEVSHDSEHYGIITYKQYNTNKLKKYI